MPDEVKIPINAKIPQQLHDKLTKAVESKDYKDKTDCITQALEKLLSNTHQEPLFNEDVLREKDAEILRITQELRATRKKNEELQEVLRVLPDEKEIAVIQARDEVLRELLDEREKRINALEDNLRDIRPFAYKQISQVSEPRNTEVIPSNTESNGLIEKKCKNCNNTFFTGNLRKEFCSGRCKTAYGRKMKKELK